MLVEIEVSTIHSVLIIREMRQLCWSTFLFLLEHLFEKLEQVIEQRILLLLLLYNDNNEESAIPYNTKYNEYSNFKPRQGSGWERFL